MKSRQIIIGAVALATALSSGVVAQSPPPGVLPGVSPTASPAVVRQAAPMTGREFMDAMTADWGYSWKPQDDGGFQVGSLNENRMIVVQPPIDQAPRGLVTEVLGGDVSQIGRVIGYLAPDGLPWFDDLTTKAATWEGEKLEGATVANGMRLEVLLAKTKTGIWAIGMLQFEPDDTTGGPSALPSPTPGS